MILWVLDSLAHFSHVKLDLGVFPLFGCQRGSLNTRDGSGRLISSSNDDKTYVHDVLQDEQRHPLKTFQQVESVPLADLLPLGVCHPAADGDLELLLDDVNEASLFNQLLGLTRDLEGSTHGLASVDEELRPLVHSVTRGDGAVVRHELDVHFHELYVPARLHASVLVSARSLVLPVALGCHQGRDLPKRLREKTRPIRNASHETS